MKTKLKTVVVALVVATTGALSARPAQAITRSECLLLAREEIQEAQDLSESNPLAYGTFADGIAVSMTGVFVLGVAQAERLGGGPDLVSLTRTSRASSVLGVALFLGAQYWEQQLLEDNLRSFRQSNSYQCLVLELGRNRAEELVTDALSGWDSYHLANKYLSREECAGLFTLYLDRPTQRHSGPTRTHGGRDEP